MNVLTPSAISRRDMLRGMGAGFGLLGLAGVLATESTARAASNPLAPRAGHFTPKAKRVIFLFMNGGPSHVDTFDPKPGLTTHDGKDPPENIPGVRKGGKLMKSPFAFQKCGAAGIEVSEIFP